MPARISLVPTFCIAALLALSVGAVRAQSATDSATAAAQQDAKDLLGARAQPPDLSTHGTPAGVHTSGNAGTANVSIPVTSHAESESHSSSHSSHFSAGFGVSGQSHMPVPGEIANQPPPPPGWPGHDHANPPPPQDADSNDPVINIDAGPIWNNNDSQGKCPRVCGNNGRVWTGDWRTVGFNKSVCARALPGHGPLPAQPAAWGPGSSCSAPANHQCGGCSVSCPAGKQAHCTAGDRGIFTSPENSICPRAAVCECR